MTARQYYYAEDQSQTTHTGDTSYSDKLTKTFAGNASKDHYLLWSAVLGCSAAAQYAAKFINNTDSVTYSDLTLTTAASSDAYSVFGMGKFTSGGSPTNKDFKLQQKTITSGNTVKMVNAAVIAIEAGANDQYAEDTTTHTNSSSSVRATAVTLTFTPPSSGDYLLIACAELQFAVTTGSVSCRLNKGGTNWGDCAYRFRATSDWVPWGTVVKLTALSGSQTFTIDFLPSSSNTLSCRNARIVALRLADLNNNYYNESRGSSTVGTADTNYHDAATVTATPSAVPHVQIGCVVLGTASTTNTTGFQYLDAATDFGTGQDSPQASAITIPTFAIHEATEAASSTTWKNQIKRIGSSIAGVKYSEAAIAVLELGTASTNWDLTLSQDITTAITATLNSNRALTVSQDITTALAATLNSNRALTHNQDITTALAASIAVTAMLTLNKDITTALTANLVRNAGLTLLNDVTTALAATLNAAYYLTCAQSTDTSMAGTLNAGRALTHNQGITTALTAAMNINAAMTLTQSADTALAATLTRNAGLALSLSSDTDILAVLQKAAAGAFAQASDTGFTGTLGVDRGLVALFVSDNNLTATLTVTKSVTFPGVMGDSNLIDSPP